MENKIEQELKKSESLKGLEFARRINEIYNEFPDKKAVIDEFMDKRLNSFIKKADDIIEAGIRFQLGEATEMLSLSYVAKHYFHKSRQWLNQRLNENIVNGKPAKFTDDQLRILNDALQDISKKIGSINVV